MYQSVRSVFLSFSTRFEGRVSYMYLDIKGLVTTGVGNLIDPVDLALQLPFVHKSDSAPATQQEIRTDWQAVKGRPDLAHAKNYLKRFDTLTALKLTDDDINRLVLSKLDSMAVTLKKTAEFADLERWPADAQLGLFSMAWAMGAGFGAGFPNFRAACAAHDWDAAAAQSGIDDTNNPGVTLRNAANHTLFSNAAQVVEQGLDYSPLQYPNDLTITSEPTQPSNISGTASLPVVYGLEPASGQSGETVIISGESFTDANSVGFGNTSVMDMSVDSDSQITVTVPNGSGTVSVVVITPAGSSDPFGAEFTYLDTGSHTEPDTAPIPVIAGLEPASGQSGDTVIISGEGFTDASSVGFGDTSVVDMSVDSDSQITVTVPNGSGTVSVVVITPAGSSDPFGAEFAYV